MSRESPSREQLVPLDPARVEMARSRLRLSVVELARKAGLRQQTVNAMLHSDPTKSRRCRRAHRDKLAEALGLPRDEGSAWLGGEVPTLSPRIGYIGGLSEGDPVLKFNSREEPSASDFARYHLLDRCRQAMARDILAREGAESGSVVRLDATAFAPLQHAVNQIADALWWRGQLLRPETPEFFIRRPSQRMKATQPVRIDSETQDRVEGLLLEAMEALLEPWLQGKAELRHENVLAMGSRWWWQPLRMEQVSTP